MDMLCVGGCIALEYTICVSGVCSTYAYGPMKQYDRIERVQSSVMRDPMNVKCFRDSLENTCIQNRLDFAFALYAIDWELYSISVMVSHFQATYIV